MIKYNTGLFSDYGGGNVQWWQDYLRAEIGRANDFCGEQYDALEADKDKQIAMLKDNIGLLISAIPEGWEVPLLYSNIVNQVEEDLKKLE